MLIGFGPHAKRIYYPLLELAHDEKSLNLPVAVDFISAKPDIEEYIFQRLLKPEIIYIDNHGNRNDELERPIKDMLDSAVKRHSINGVIISTEPLAHMQYAK